MPLHALLTRRSRCPDPAGALACDGVTRPRQRPPRRTLTLLAAAAWGVWVTVVTCGTPAGAQGGAGIVFLRQQEGRTPVLPLAVFPLVSLGTGGACVVLQSLRCTSWAKTFDTRDKKTP